MRGWTKSDVNQLLLCARDDVRAGHLERAAYFLAAIDSPVARNALRLLADGATRDAILAALGESSEGVKVMSPAPKECHKVRR